MPGHLRLMRRRWLCTSLRIERHEGRVMCDGAVSDRASGASGVGRRRPAICSTQVAARSAASPVRRVTPKGWGGSSGNSAASVVVGPRCPGSSPTTASSRRVGGAVMGMSALCGCVRTRRAERGHRGCRRCRFGFPAVRLPLLLGGVQRGVQQEAGGQSQAAGVDCHTEERSGQGSEGTGKRLHLRNRCGSGQFDDEGEGHGGVLEPIKPCEGGSFCRFSSGQSVSEARQWLTTIISDNRW